MNRKEIVDSLSEILIEFQEDVTNDVADIDEDTRPIGDLPGFDSLAGIDATVHCVERFGLNDSDEVQSLFVGEDAQGRPCALTVGQVADRIMELGPSA